jgi:hypothetical protein
VPDVAADWLFEASVFQRQMNSRKQLGFRLFHLEFTATLLMHDYQKLFDYL